MRPVETVLRKGGRKVKEKDGGGESNSESVTCTPLKLQYANK
jgi:hypothetical protein